ncbi:6-carboxytetrahydropterin synthase [bacterium]|nr:6-carboxytetrahydropterin synthase [bacterium]
MSNTILLICSYEICAGHRLYRDDWSLQKNQQVYGKCANTHGHQYKMELTLEGPISTETGMLLNAHDVEALVRPFIDQYFDHKYLNDDVPFFKTHQPTAEWICVWVFDELKNKFPKPATLKKVRIYETHDIAAQYPA